MDEHSVLIFTALLNRVVDGAFKLNYILLSVGTSFLRIFTVTLHWMDNHTFTILLHISFFDFVKCWNFSSPT